MTGDVQITFWTELVLGEFSKIFGKLLYNETLLGGDMTLILSSLICCAHLAWYWVEHPQRDDNLCPPTYIIYSTII